MQDDIYMQGFLEKLAEAGISPDDFIKLAGFKDFTNLAGKTIRSFIPSSSAAGEVVKKTVSPALLLKQEQAAQALLLKQKQMASATARLKELGLEHTMSMGAVNPDAVRAYPRVTNIAPFTEGGNNAKYLAQLDAQALAGKTTYASGVRPAQPTSTPQVKTSQDYYNQGFIDKCAEYNIDPAIILNMIKR